MCNMQTRYAVHMETNGPVARTLRLSLSLSLPLAHAEGTFHLCGQTADYAAEFARVLLTERSPPLSIERLKERVDTVCFVINELLENAYKFRAAEQIRLDLELTENSLLCVVRNHIADAQIAALESRLSALLRGNPQELLRQTVEEHVLVGDTTCSGLGLLSILGDHGVPLSWMLEPAGGGRSILAVRADIPIPVAEV